MRFPRKERRAAARVECEILGHKWEPRPNKWVSGYTSTQCARCNKVYHHELKVDWATP